MAVPALTTFLGKIGSAANDDAPLTIAEAAGLWISACARRGLEQSTIRQYQQHLEYHLCPLVGPLLLCELTTPIVQRLADELVEQRGAATAKKAIASLKSLLTEAQRQGHVRDNVAKPVTVRRPRCVVERCVMPSIDEARCIIEAAGARWKALFATAAMTGLRASELRALAWSEVDFEAGIVKVRRRADRWNVIGPPKSTSGRRDVPIGPRLAACLREHRRWCGENDLGLAFATGNGRIETLSNIWRRGLAPAQRRAGVIGPTGKPKYGMHAFRHFAASLFIASRKFSPKEIQIILGHASVVETFDVYGHLFAKRDDIGVVMRDLEAVVFPDRAV